MAHEGSLTSRLMHRLRLDETKLKSIREKSEEMMGHAKTLAEVTAANGAWAYANGRFGTEGAGPDQHIALMGVPADLGAAVALGGLGLLGAAGKYSEDVFNLGVGSLQSFVSRNLLSMGLAASHAQGTTAGALPYGNPYAYGAYGAQHSYARG